MLSFGMEYDRAFSIAFWSARFAVGSAPPSRAATMIARDSLEKSLPRLASAAPFLCLMDDHLLCPDISPSWPPPAPARRSRAPPEADTARGSLLRARRLSVPLVLACAPRARRLCDPCPRSARLLLDQLQEPLVHAGVVGQLGVKRREQQPAVADEHRFALEQPEHLDTVAELADARGADEDAAKRLVGAHEIDVRLEALQLPTVGVALDLD